LVWVVTFLARPQGKAKSVVREVCACLGTPGKKQNVSASLALSGRHVCSCVHRTTMVKSVAGTENVSPMGIRECASATRTSLAELAPKVAQKIKVALFAAGKENVS